MPLCRQGNIAIKLQDIKSVTENKCDRNSDNMAEGERFGKWRMKNHM